jgi:hypothetical protein
MAKKKRIVRKKSPSKNKSSANIHENKIFSRPKLGLVIKNLVLFVLLSLISYVLSVIISEDNVFSSLFGILWIIFLLIALAFFLALLTLLVLKWMRR